MHSPEPGRDAAIPPGPMPKIGAVLIATAMAAACGTHVIHHESFVSPDGIYVADWEQDMGGGAAGFAATRVCVRTVRPHLFFSRSCIFGAVDLVDVEVRWQSPRELEIAYPSQGDEAVTTMFDRWRDIKVRFTRRAPLTR
jgi:hypothetical protein